MFKKKNKEKASAENFKIRIEKVESLPTAIWNRAASPAFEKVDPVLQNFWNKAASPAPPSLNYFDHRKEESGRGVDPLSPLYEAVSPPAQAIKGPDVISEALEPQPNYNCVVDLVTEEEEDQEYVEIEHPSRDPRLAPRQQGSRGRRERWVTIPPPAPALANLTHSGSSSIGSSTSRVSTCQKREAELKKRKKLSKTVSSSPPLPGPKPTSLPAFIVCNKTHPASGLTPALSDLKLPEVKQEPAAQHTFTHSNLSPFSEVQSAQKVSEGPTLPVRNVDVKIEQLEKQIKSLKDDLARKELKVSRLIRRLTQFQFSVFQSVNLLNAMHLTCFSTLDQLSASYNPIQLSIAELFLKNFLLPDINLLKSAMPNTIFNIDDVQDDCFVSNSNCSSNSILNLKHSVIMKCASMLNVDVEIRGIRLTPTANISSNTKV